jgi:hypothetical protein
VNERAGARQVLMYAHEARFFEQVAADASAGNEAVAAEPQLDELSKARGVVVARGLCVAKSLHNGVCVKDLRLQLAYSVPSADSSKIGHDIPSNNVTLSKCAKRTLRALGALCFATAALAADDDALVALVPQEAANLLTKTAQISNATGVEARGTCETRCPPE